MNIGKAIEIPVSQRQPKMLRSFPIAYFLKMLLMKSKKHVSDRGEMEIQHSYVC